MDLVTPLPPEDEGPMILRRSRSLQRLRQLMGTDGSDKNSKSTTTLRSQLDPCEKHSGKFKGGHCVTCQTTVCQECQKNDHHGGKHRVEHIQDAYGRVREQWEKREDMRKEVRARVKAFEESENKIDQLHAEGLENLIQMRRDLEGQIQALRYYRCEGGKKRISVVITFNYANMVLPSSIPAGKVYANFVNFLITSAKTCFSARA